MNDTKSGCRTRTTLTEIVADLEQSLERLGLDAVDLFMLHRDNQEVEPAVLLDALEAVRDMGLTRMVGVSNWTYERVGSGLSDGYGIDAVSNYYGLGVPAGPPALPGLVSAFGSRFHELLAQSGIPLLA